MTVTEQPAKVTARLQWMTVRVMEVIEETPRVRSLVLDVPAWPGHRAGQHVDVRLTGEDGYQAQRSYSIASAPEAPRHYAHRRAHRRRRSVVVSRRRGARRRRVRIARADRRLFRLDGGARRPAVPRRRRLRRGAADGHAAPPRARRNGTAPATLLYSSRSTDDIIYRAELERLAGQGVKVVHTLTRVQPPGWSGFARRIDRAMLEATGFPASARPRIFVCGPTPLVEAAARSLRDIGHAPNLIKTERFGPTGS